MIAHRDRVYFVSREEQLCWIGFIYSIYTEEPLLDKVYTFAIEAASGIAYVLSQSREMLQYRLEDRKKLYSKKIEVFSNHIASAVAVSGEVLLVASIEDRRFYKETTENCVTLLNRHFESVANIKLSNISMTSNPASARWRQWKAGRKSDKKPEDPNDQGSVVRDRELRGKLGAHPAVR